MRGKLPSATSSLTRKAGNTEEGPKDTGKTSSQAKYTAEIERRSRISREGNADLQAALRVAAIFVYPGALDEIAHGAEVCGAYRTLGCWAFWIRIDLIP